ncbi:hypothetical protein [Streptomyces sp. NPDC003863]
MGNLFPSRTFSAVLPVSLAAALLAGCGSPADGRTGAGAAGVPAADAPAAVAVPKITTAVIDPVPVESYLLTEEQWGKLGRAESVLRVRCMKRFGITYEEPMPAASSTQTVSQYRYGKLDPAKTAVLGYKSAEAASSGALADAEMKAAKERQMRITGSERMVLLGTANPTEKTGAGGQDFHGRKVPQGGCVGEAQRRLGNYGDAQVANDVNLDSFGRSLQDGRVRAVFAKWSRCMEKKGYHYKTPIEASDDKRWQGERASAEEKKVATVDAECKIENNVAGIWYAVDVAYQKQAIEAHAEELDQVRKDIAGQVKAASEVLGG